MSTVPHPAPRQTPPVVPRPLSDGTDLRWATLLAEMSELHAKLEYLRLMLRLQQQQPGGTAPR